MLITLKEAEIATAVKRYLATQGINLSGKAVAIEFTATRSNGGGIRADVSIDELESDIPGYSDAAEDEAVAETTKPALAAVPAPQFTPAEAVPIAAPAVATPAKSVKEIAAAAAAVVLEDDKPEVAETASVKPTTSLFGS